MKCNDCKNDFPEDLLCLSAKACLDCMQKGLIKMSKSSLGRALAPIQKMKIQVLKIAIKKYHENHNL